MKTKALILGVLLVVLAGVVFAEFPTAQGTKRGGFPPPQGDTSTVTAIPSDGDSDTDPLIRIDGTSATNVVHGGLVLDGSSGAEETPTTFPLTDYPFTVVTVLSVADATPAAPEVIWEIARDDEDSDISLSLRPAGNIGFNIEIAGTGTFTQTGAAVFPNNTTSVVLTVVVTSSTSASYSLNGGSLVAFGAYNVAWPGSGYTELNVGQTGNSGGTPSNGLNGTIHELAIYNKALTNEECRAFYAGVRAADLDSSALVRHWILNSATDKASAKVLGTLAGTPSFSSGDVVFAHSDIGPIHRGSLRTVASTSYATASAPSGVDYDDFSVTTWWRTDSTNGDLVNLSDGTTTNQEGLSWNGTNLIHTFRSSGGNNTISGSAAIGGNVNQWYVGTFSKRGTTSRELYFQGNSLGTDTSSVVDNASNLDTLDVGRAPGGTGSGTRQAITSIHSPALTDEQVALLHAGVDPRSVGTCVNYWKYDDGVVTVVGETDLTLSGSPTVDTTEFIQSGRLSFRQLTLASQPSFSSGIVFNGSSEYLELVRASPLVVNAPYTVLVTADPSAAATQTYLGTGNSSTHDDEQHEFALTSGDVQTFRTEAGASTEWNVNGGSVVADSNTFVTTLTAAGVRNVRTNGTDSTSTDAGKTDPTLATRLLLGAGVGAAGAADDHFTGTITRVEILPRVVTESELLLREAQ